MRRISTQIAVALLVVLASMTPSAASPQIGLSRDGITFAPSLDAPLFDPVLRWVPGDMRIESFYVRNLAVDDGDLSIDIIESSDSMLETGGLMVSARGGDAIWRDVTAPGTHRIVSAADLATGRTAKVDVRVALLPDAANPTQVRRLGLDVRVLLSQDVDRSTPDDSGLLPDTGAPASWSLIAGLALVAGGTVLVQARRKKENSHV